MLTDTRVYFPKKKDEVKPTIFDGTERVEFEQKPERIEKVERFEPKKHSFIAMVMKDQNRERTGKLLDREKDLFQGFDV
jgi:hypothetical protein